MPTRGGEESPAKGERFDEASARLLVGLGYKVLLRRRLGFDMIADPPQRSQLTAPLLFAPAGRTAFEYKGGKGPSIQSLAKTLRKKVKGAVRSPEPSVRKTGSGVAIVEGYVSDTIKRKMVSKFSISVWDFRTILFVLSKLLVLLLSSSPKRPVELILDASTTVVYETQSYRRTVRFFCSLFYQHPFEQLGIERLGSILDRLTSKLNAIADRLTEPVYATVDIFALPGFSGEIDEETVMEMIEGQSGGRIIYDPQSVHTFGFDTAPWSFLLSRESR